MSYMIVLIGNANVDATFWRDVRTRDTVCGTQTAQHSLADAVRSYALEFMDKMVCWRRIMYPMYMTAHYCMLSFPVRPKAHDAFAIWTRR